MMIKRILIVVPIAIVLGGSAAWGQRDPGRPNPRGEGAPPQNREEAMERARLGREGMPGPQGRVPGWVGEGMIHSLAGNQINMVIAGNQPWRVRIENGAQLSTKGEISPALLRPRVVVRFKALLTARDVAVEPITELEVFTPRTGFVSGKEIPTPDEESADQPEDFAPESEAGEVAADDAAEDEVVEDEASPLRRRPPPRTRQRGRNDNDEAAAQEYEVTGVVLSFKRGKLLVNAGEGGKIRAELAEDARVKVNLQSLDLAQPGAKIKVSGLAMPNFDGLGGDVVARSVEVTLAPPAPSADPNERPRRRR